MYLIVIKANLILDKIRLNIPFNFAIPQPLHLFLQTPFGLGTWQNFLDKDSRLLDNQIYYISACPRHKWIRKCFSDSVSLP